ncbi:MAG: AI-2E family transporter [Candidatus Acidiferrales bacterium]
MSETQGRERIVTALFYAVIILLAWLVYRIFEPFLMPLGWAAVIVVVFHPWHERFERRWGKGRAAAASTVAVTLIVILPALLLGVATVREGLEAVQSFQAARAAGQHTLVDSAQEAWDWVQARIPVSMSLNLGELMREAAQRVGTFLASKTGAVVANVLGFFFDFFVTLFAVFFFFRDREAIVNRFRQLLPFEPQQRAEIIEGARDLIHASVTASLIVASVQGALGTAVFWMLGIVAPLFWGVVMGFFALIPGLGTGVVLAPAVVWLAVSGQWVKAIILAAVGALVIGLVDNVLRPILVSGRSRMNALVLFISMLGGVAAFGLLGLVLGPVVVATAATVTDAYLRRGETAPVAAADSPSRSV